MLCVREVGCNNRKLLGREARKNMWDGEIKIRARIHH